MADISAERGTINGQLSSPPLQGERVAFTGTLASMRHREAQRLVGENGGTATEHVSRQTTMLVLGEEGWPLEQDGQPSQKLQQAEAWNRQGADIRILKESEWLYLLGLDERHDEVHRVHTPAMLSQLLDVPVSRIRSWERSGLIQPVRKVHRLPYFDFQEVAGARRLAELMDSGVSRKELETSLSHLQEVLPEVERPLAQLEILAENRRLIYRDRWGLLEPLSGQRLLDFETTGEEEQSLAQQPSVVRWQRGEADNSPALPCSAEEWFEQGCRFSEADEPASAVEAYRLALMEKPGDAEVNFHLAEALYRSGNVAGALERYYAALEADPNYLEAWTQLGCVHAERGEIESALNAFQIALQRHPDYPDAHWHTADLLQQLGRLEEAASHWEVYLEHDHRGPWAEHARQQLDQPQDR